jgi:hypothetical protein
MSVTINASLTSGAIISSDTSGSLQLQTNSGTTALTIDTSQRVGIGTSTFNVYNNFVGAQLDQSAPTRLLINNQANNASASAEFTMAAYGNSWTTGIGSSSKNSNALTWALDATAGTPSVKMTLDTSGNLGLGVTPNAWVSTWRAFQMGGGSQAGTLYANAGGTTGQIGVAQNWYFNGSSNLYLTSAAASDYYQYAGTHVWRIASSGTAGNAVSFTQAMTLDNSGNLCMVASNAASFPTIAGIYLYGQNPGYILNNSTSAGGVSLALFYSSYSTANQTKFEVTSEGNVKSRTNSYAGFSDERLKQNITPSASQWNAIKDIEVVKFQFKSEQFSDEQNPWMLGVVAQQVEQTSPGLVDVDPKDGMKTVKYSILYMKAVKALQEAMERIETLETELNALKLKVGG